MAGRFGQGMSFNGAGSMVSVADSASLHLSGAMTVEAWVYPTAASTDWTAVVLKERGTTGLAYGLYATDGANEPPAGYIDKSNIDYNATGTSVLPLNTWTHLAVTYSGSALRLYVNGTQAASRSLSGTIASSTAPLRIGGDWSGEMFTGAIDNVRVYNRALSAAEITTDMNSAVGGGSPQLAAEGPVPGGSAPVLTRAELAPVAAEAVRRWLAAGVTPAQADALAHAQFQIADLGSTGDLGLTPIGGPLVEIDDGAGRGWFVDPAPGGDAEFAVRVDGGGLRADAGPAAAAYDLLTVVMHELGHVIGLGDHDAGPADLMAAALPLGTRRATPPTTPAVVAADPLPVAAPSPSAPAQMPADRGDPLPAAVLAASPARFVDLPHAAVAVPPAAVVSDPGSPTPPPGRAATPAVVGIAARSLLDGADRPSDRPPTQSSEDNVSRPTELAALPTAPPSERRPEADGLGPAVSVAWGGASLFRPVGGRADLWWGIDLPG